MIHVTPAQDLLKSEKQRVKNYLHSVKHKRQDKIVLNKSDFFKLLFN